MDSAQALEKLRSIGQQHLFNDYDTLSPHGQSALLCQIAAINIPTLREQQQLLETGTDTVMKMIEPFVDYSTRGNAEDQKTGLQLMTEGKVGCIFIAGGQGTRLRIDGPKGKVPVSLIKQKSLFQLFAEKTLAAGKRAGRALSIAVMTSQQNHEETLTFFATHSLFGLDPKQLSFFVQGTLPVLDRQGNLFLDKRDHIAEGPDGNGSSLLHFVESGIWEKWYESGIRYASYVLIDNVLADPFDAELLGYQVREGADLVVKCTSRQDPKESVGIVVKHEDRVKVVEYSEFPEQEKAANDDEGRLKHLCANLSLFNFTMDFVKKVSKLAMPLHLAHKAIPFLNRERKTEKPEKPNAWKYEKFIFDVLPYALKVSALLYPRDECFAPLKNLTGEGSLEGVQKALLTRDRKILREITGNPPPDGPLELSQEFYYPTPELLKEWKGRKIQKSGYINIKEEF